MGDIVDPKTIRKYHQSKNKCGKGGMKLNFKERKYLLDLRTERPDRPNYNYKQKMFQTFGRKFCTKTISNFFVQKGNLCSKERFVFQTKL